MPWDLWCRRTLTSQQPFADRIATPAHNRTSVPKDAQSRKIVRDVGTRENVGSPALTDVCIATFSPATPGFNLKGAACEAVVHKM